MTLLTSVKPINFLKKKENVKQRGLRASALQVPEGSSDEAAFPLQLRAASSHAKNRPLKSDVPITLTLQLSEPGGTEIWRNEPTFYFNTYAKSGMLRFKLS